MTIEQGKAIVEAYCNASQKQIEIFEKAFPSQKSSARSDKEAFEIAIEALEKQISKKPISHGKYRFVCPFCKEILGVEREDISVYDMTPPKHCSECGQALDWSDTE